MRFSFFNLLFFLITVNCLFGSSNSYLLDLYENSMRLYNIIGNYIQFKYKKVKATITNFYKKAKGDKINKEDDFDSQTMNETINNDELKAAFQKLFEMFKENNMMKDEENLNENSQEKVIENESVSSDKNSIEMEKQVL